MAKVLLVEDDNNLREIYQARLTAEGYDIVAAQNGEDALVLAKQHHPDLVISDVMMPRISGYEMLDILRNTEELKHTKVIMLTALGQNEDKERAGKLGADKYLVKSQVTLEDIVNSAKALLADDSVGAPQTVAPDPADPLGMASTSTADDTVPVQSVSPVAAPVTPLSSVVEPVEEEAPVVETPVAVAPEQAQEAQPQPEVTPATTPAEFVPVPEPVAPQPVEAPSTAFTPEPSEIPSIVTAEPSEAPLDSLATATNATTTPDPVRVDDLINGDPVATETVAEVAQAEVGEAQSTQNEQALVDQQIASFNQSEVPSAVEAAGPQPEPSTSVNQENDATLTDALHTLTTETPTEAVAVAPVVTEPETQTAVEPTPSHDIEGLSGVTEVVEVPSEHHVDPTPSPTATVIQPVLNEPAASEPTTPMTQTVVPTEMPQTPVEPPATGPDNDGVNVVGKKVIQPLSDPSSKPDLDKLLAQEEAKQSGEAVPQAPTANTEPAAPTTKPQNGFDPNNIAL